MKKDIWVIREAIGKIVGLLTKQAIKVTQRGAKAYVQYNTRTGTVDLVNIPYLPDDASDEFIAAVQGFLDHEVGHVLYTDRAVVKQAAAAGKRVKNLHNAIEDIYVERRMGLAFPGAVANLDATRGFHVKHVAMPKIKEAIAAGDLGTAAGYAAILQFRAWGGQTIAIDALKANPEIAALVAPMAERLGPELIARLKNIKSSAEALEVAGKFREALEPPPPPSKDDMDGGPDGTPSGKASPSGDASADADDDTDADSSDESGEPPEDAGTEKTEADGSGKKREDGPSETDKKTDEAGEEGGDADAAEGDKDEPAEPAAESEAPEGTDDPSDDAGSEPEPDDAGSDSDGDRADDGAEESEDLGDEAGAGGGAAEDPEGEETDEGTGAEGGEEDPSGDALASGEESELADDTPPPKGSSEKPPAEKKEGEESEEEGEGEGETEPDLTEHFEDERDFDEEISEALTERATKEIGESDYKIFSTDWDVIEPAPKAKNEASIVSMVNATQPMIASIQKGLERAMASRARKTWNPGQRRGRISAGSLFRTAVGDDRVFRQRYETHAKTTAISLVVDCSGSMSGSKIRTAGMAAYALSATLERLKLKHEVIGFTTRVSRAMSTAIHAEGMGLRYARLEALYMPVFKGFGDRLDVDARSRMAHLIEGPEWLRENVDGESIKLAAHRLVAQNSERHIMIVLSDGNPACSGDYGALTRHLRESVKSLDGAKTLEVVGIGIEDHSVSSFYKKHVVLTDLEELPTTVVSQLAKILLAE